MSRDTSNSGAPLGARVGRPRHPEVEERVLRAAREELSDRGVSGFSIRSVAHRAGVARSSLLLRWPEADGLIIDALDSVSIPELPDLPGTLVGDLEVVLDVVADQMGSEAMDLQMRVLADAQAHPGLLARYQERLLHPAAKRLDAVLRAAVDRGELSQDVDRPLLADCLVGVVYIRTMASADREPPGPRSRRLLIERILQSVSR